MFRGKHVLIFTCRQTDAKGKFIPEHLFYTVQCVGNILIGEENTSHQLSVKQRRARI